MTGAVIAGGGGLLVGLGMAIWIAVLHRRIAAATKRATKAEATAKEQKLTIDTLNKAIADRDDTIARQEKRIAADEATIERLRALRLEDASADELAEMLEAKMLPSPR